MNPLAIFLFFATVAFGQGNEQYFVNMGGSDVLDSVWTAYDATDGFEVASLHNIQTYRTPVGRIPNGDRFVEDLFNSELWGPRTDLSFTFEVTSQTQYKLCMYFMESFLTIDDKPREFNIVVNNKKLETVKPVELAGGIRRAGEYCTMVVSESEKIRVQLTPVVDNPQINAVELTPFGNGDVADGPSAGLGLEPQESLELAPEIAPGPSDEALVPGEEATLPIDVAFNEGFFVCDKADPLECIDDDVFDVDLPPLEVGPFVVNLPYANFRQMEPLSFGIKELGVQASGDQQITAVRFDYGDGTTGPLNTAPFQVSFPGQAGHVSGQGLVQLREAFILEGQSTSIFRAVFRPAGQEGRYEALVTFMNGSDELFTIPMVGTSPLLLDSGLHVENIFDNVMLDWEDNSKVRCRFDGSRTHVHHSGNTLPDTYQWWDLEDNVLGVGVVLETECPLGLNQGIYQVAFDNLGNSVANLAQFHVARYDKAPGMYVKFYGSAGNLQAGRLSDKAPPARPNIAIMSELSSVNGPPRLFTAADGTHIVQAKFFLRDSDGKEVSLRTEGGAKSRIFIGGKLYEDGEVIVYDQEPVDVRFRVDNVGQYPLNIRLVRDGKSVEMGLDDMFHDQGVEGASLHSLSPARGQQSGDRVQINGIAINFDQVDVFVDGKKLDSSAILERHDEQLVVQMPPGPEVGGFVKVHVEQPSGDGSFRITSNSLQYEYLDADTDFADIKFTRVHNELRFNAVRTRTCFGHTFFTTHDFSNTLESRQGGMVYYTKVDDNYQVGEMVEITTIRENAIYDDEILNEPQFLWSILGVACDPWGSDDNFDVYFSVSRTFWVERSDGEDLTGYLPFMGAVVRLNSAENFETMHWVIQNLPMSGFDHSVNQLDFLPDRRLLIALGGQTNAGWPSHKYGGMFESPLTAAVLAAPVTKEGFNGFIEYEFIEGTPEVHPHFIEGDTIPPEERVTTNQRWGDWLRVKEGVDIDYYVTGTRNPFDIYVTPDGFVYSTDNGPNRNFGGYVVGYDDDAELPLLEGAANGGAEVALNDEINLLEEGLWYGHPNVARYRADREGKPYEALWEPQTSTVRTNVYVPPMQVLTSPSEGLMFYRANAFGGNAYGNLFVGHHGIGTFRVILSTNGLSVESFLLDEEEDLPVSQLLDVKDFPGGAVCGVTYQGQDRAFICHVPDDDNAQSGEPLLYQVDPFRAPVTRSGPLTYTISGANFGSGPVTVTFGGVEAEVTEVTDTRIRGLLPDLGKSGPQDVVVNFGSVSRRLSGTQHFYGLEDQPQTLDKSIANCRSTDGQTCVAEF